MPDGPAAATPAPDASPPGGADRPAPPTATTIVVITRDRRDGLLATLPRLLALPGSPPVIVVDNGSTDGTAVAVEAAHGHRVDVVALPRNAGAAGRTVGVRRAGTPFVAFADDDSWWRPDALARAEAAFAAHPRLAVVAARVLVGPGDVPDPVSAAMAASPLPRADLPGPAVLGFLACGAVVRRAAYLEVGGFAGLLGLMAEEGLLASDLAAAGWALTYLDDVVAHHHPSPVRDPMARRRLHARNDVLVTWMRRPLGRAVADTAALAASARRDPEARAVLAAVVRALPAALRRRRRLPADVEAALRRLEARG